MSFLAWMFLFFIPIVIVWVAIAFYVKGDAKRRGRDHTTWFFITLVLGLLGLILYLISITPNGESTNQNEHIPWETPAPQGNTQREHIAESQIAWEGCDSSDMKIKKVGRNHDGDPIVLVKHMDKKGRFVLAENGIRPQSPRYERKFGKTWVDTVESNLQTEFDLPIQFREGVMDMSRKG